MNPVSDPLLARGVSHYYSHPEYNSASDAHDIAVLELDDALIFSDYVQPACLPTREPIPKTVCEVAGWGSQVSFRDLNIVLKKSRSRQRSHLLMKFSTRSVCFMNICPTLSKFQISVALEGTPMSIH